MKKRLEKDEIRVMKLSREAIAEMLWESFMEMYHDRLDIPNDDGTILAREQDSYAAVILTLNSDMSDEQAQGLAQYIATQLGNDTTDNVLILDSNSNVGRRF